MKSKFTQISLVGVLCCALGIGLWLISSGALRPAHAQAMPLGGIVSDGQGAAMAGITVVALLQVNDATGSEWQPVQSITTATDGSFTFDELATGDYRLIVNASGAVVESDTIEFGLGLTFEVEDVEMSASALLATGSISGRLSGPNGEGAKSVRVVAYRQSSNGNYAAYRTAYANLNGDYVLGTLEDGVYRLRFKDDYSIRRYETEFYNEADSLQNAKDLTISAGQSISGIDTQLTATIFLGSISGTLTDSASLPAQSVRAVAYRSNIGVNNTLVWYQFRTGFSDSAGNYRLPDLSVGDYRLRFKDDRIPRRYATEFYQNTTRLDFATPLVIIDRPISDINAQLEDANSRTAIVGKVTTQAGAAIEGIAVSVYEVLGNNSFVIAAITSSGSDGSYRLDNLLPGRLYRLEARDGRAQPSFSATFYNGKRALSEADNIAPPPGDELTMNIKMSGGGNINGRIFDDAGAALPFVRVCVLLPSTREPCLAGATSDASGSFGIVNLAPGPYKLQFVDTRVPAQYIATFYGDPNSGGNTITVIEYSTVSDANANLDKQGHLSGRVTDSSGQPIADIRVRGQVQDGTLIDIAEAFTNQSGDYDLTGFTLVADRYPTSVHIYFDGSQAGYLSEYFDDVADLTAAKPVQIIPGQIVSGVNAVLATQPISLNLHANDDQFNLSSAEAADGMTINETVLLNDQVPAGDGWVVELVEIPQYGAVAFESNGAFIYMSTSVLASSDSFRYRLRDGSDVSNVAIVTIQLSPVADKASGKVYLPMISR